MGGFDTESMFVNTGCNEVACAYVYAWVCRGQKATSFFTFFTQESKIIFYFFLSGDSTSHWSETYHFD